MSANEFEVTNVKKSYSGQIALNNITFSVSPGSMNFLLGANGSGKSTLLQCMAGHQRWDSGDILWRGNSRKSDRHDFNKGLHLVSEDIAPPMASLNDLKSLYQAVYNHWDEVLFKQFLDWSGLSLSQNLTGVSRGQKIQALLGLSLATHPEVLLVDEATAVLDPFIRNRLMVEIEKQNKSTGMTVLIATNIATELKALHGRFLILQKGNIAIDRKHENISDGFIKIRVALKDSDEAQIGGFSFIAKNEDDSMSFIGTVDSIRKLKIEYQTDNRTISFDEIFIFYSDRKTA